MKLVSLQRTAAEKKAEEQHWKEASPEAPDYPWGLRLSLGEKEIAKLGLGNPKLGDVLDLTGKVKVVSVSMSESENHKHQSVELVLTDAAIGGDDGPSATEVLYGGSK